MTTWLCRCYVSTLTVRTLLYWGTPFVPNNVFGNCWFCWWNLRRINRMKLKWLSYRLKMFLSWTIDWWSSRNLCFRFKIWPKSTTSRHCCLNSQWVLLTPWRSFILLSQRSTIDTTLTEQWIFFLMSTRLNFLCWMCMRVTITRLYCLMQANT